MKKIGKKISNMNSLTVVLICIVIVAIFFAISTDPISKICFGTVMIPVLMYILQNIIQKIQENNFYNIDLYMVDKVDNEVIWMVDRNNLCKDKVYVIIQNTGKVDIFRIYIKVTEIKGASNYYSICDTLSTNKKYIVELPYCKENIDEIVVTGDLQTESRTKKFNGSKSGNENMYIFSNSEQLDGEKYALYKEKDFREFKKLGRYFLA